MATQLFQAPHGSPAWFHMMVSKAASEGRTYTESIVMTPDLAVELLRKNPDNRGVRRSKVEQIVKDIVANRWTFNGEAVLVSKEGLLNDGQHRCNAVIEANMGIKTLITFGLERESRTTLDQGVARVASDYMVMAGTPIATTAAAIIRFLIAYENAEGKSLGQRASISNAEIVARYSADPQIAESARFASRHHKDYRRKATPQIIGFCHAVFSRINADDANTFLEQVCVGENIRKTYPAFAVRAGLDRDRITPVERVHLIFRGWNAFRQKRKLELTKVVGSNLPALV